MKNTPFPFISPTKNDYFDPNSWFTREKRSTKRNDDNDDQEQDSSSEDSFIHKRLKTLTEVDEDAISKTEDTINNDEISNLLNVNEIYEGIEKEVNENLKRTELEHEHKKNLPKVEIETCEFYSLFHTN